MTTIRINARAVLGRAIEEGVSDGVRRSFKHTEHPTPGAIAEHIETAIFDALSEVLDVPTQQERDDSE